MFSINIQHMESKMFESEYRDLAFVPRWSIARTHHTQSVAEHSYYVALYSMQICQFMANRKRLNHERKEWAAWCGMREDAIAYAVVHDASEAYMSDIPGPVKRNIVDKEKAQEYEMRMNVAIYGDECLPMDIASKSVVKVADLMDEYAFWMVESGLGNVFCGQILPRICDRLNDAVRKLPFCNEEDAVALLQAFFNGITKPKTIPENNQDVAP